MRRSREESIQRRDVEIQRRDVPESSKNQRRDVKISRRDVPEKGKTNVATLRSHITTLQRGGLIQRRDVRVQRLDVPEKGQTDVATLRRRDVTTSRRYNVATLRVNVATLQRRPKMYIMQPWSKIRENSPRAIVTLWTFVVLCMSGSSPILSIAGPESRHPKRDSDYGQQQ